MAGDLKEAHGVAESFDTASWFFENGLDVFVVMRDRLLAQVNPAWTTLTGWTAEESIGRMMDEFSHRENMASINAAMRQIDSYGFAETDVRVRTKDGRWLWMACRIRSNKGGLIMAVMRDITSERQRQIEAEHAAKSVELLRAAAGVYLWTFDPESGRYTTEMERRQGSRELGPNSMSGGQMSDNIHPDDREAFGKAFFPTLKTGEAAQFSYRYISPTGEGWVRYRTAWRGVRQCENGKWEISGLTQDVTELEEAREAAVLGEQAAKDAAEIKSQFLANMSHEIRTPLNGVLGVLHLLKNEQLSDEGRGLLTEALNCGSMLAELLNDVLDFSKIEAGALELESQPVDIAAVIDGVAAILRPQVEAKGLSFTTHIQPGVGWVSTDPVRLRQVLFNLIGNAVKFTAEGGVCIHLKTVGEGSGRRLRFEISDTGIGISPEAQDRLFARFHQADGSTTRRFGGTGLGLAITKRLAELMGGDVGVESIEGEGSTFWIEILAPEIEAVQTVEAADGAWLEGLRILVVEDNPTNRLIATKMLENLGAAVETAENGALGVKAVKQTDYDIIFMDVQMPVMDGVTAAKAIRALAPPMCHVPVIAMTANAMAHQTREYLSAGMNGVVSKPLSPAAIIREIAKLAGDDESAAA